MPGDTLRLATFNVENLFARYRFREAPEPVGVDGFTINNLAFGLQHDDAKRLTADAIRALDADTIALQEVESLPVLDRFTSGHLKGMGYDHRIVIDGNDRRQIDVAVLSRYPFFHLKTHRHERSTVKPTPLFSRDCLEAVIDVGGRPLTLYVNHFKSMGGGRAETRPWREEQANRVAALLDAGWRASGYCGNFAVLGDFNDYIDPGTALERLVGHPELVNIVDRLPKTERWTHYYKRGAPGERTKQLDYLLLGRDLDLRAGHPTPTVMRKGLPRRAKDYAGKRFAGVGRNNPKASDHCPLAVDLPIAALDLG